MRRLTLGHRLEYLGYRLGLGVLRLLPEGVALRLGEGMGWMVGVVLGIRRRTVRVHLHQAFPDKTEAWRRRVARASFRHLGREAVAIFLLGRMSREEVLERTEVPGFSTLEEAMKSGRGVVLITGHCGNWEIAGAALAARGIPLDVVAQRQRNSLFDADLNRTRRRLGMSVIPRGEAPKEVLRSLRRGRAVAIAWDQNVRRGGIFVEFFGKKASTARGPALFPLRTGSPVFQGVNRLVERDPPRYRLEIVPVEVPSTGDPGQDILRLTEAYARYLEEEVTRTPEQYFWQHRRWKTQPSVE